jgi:hypothetical protein
MSLDGHLCLPFAASVLVERRSNTCPFKQEARPKGSPILART